MKRVPLGARALALFLGLSACGSSTPDGAAPGTAASVARALLSAAESLYAPGA